MGTTRVTRRFEVDAAHRLPEHEGKCRNLHGHRYVFEVTVDAEPDVMGRVMDFYAMKEIIGGWLDSHWDHATLVWMKDHALAEWLEANDQTYYDMTEPPTIEHMVVELVDVLDDIAKERNEPWRVTRVVGWETPNCCAIWRESQ